MKLPEGRVIRVIVEPAQQKALLEAAQRANLPLATWVRVVALQAAQFTPAETNPVGNRNPDQTEGIRT
jgi:hypothetical protein